MIAPLRASALRLAAGGTLGLLAAGVLLFALPSAAGRSRRAAQGAERAGQQLKALEADLRRDQALAARLRAGRQVLERLLTTMPAEPAGHLQWQLSRALFELAGRSQVRLESVKYAAPSREGAKGSALEALDVDFTAVGIYPDLKAFMLALEDARLPFAVVGAKLDQAPDGARLSVILRAFRQVPEARGEGA